MGWREVDCGLSWSADAGAEVQAGLQAPLQAMLLPRCMSCTLHDLSLLREWPIAVSCWQQLWCLAGTQSSALGQAAADRSAAAGGAGCATTLDFNAIIPVGAVLLSCWHAMLSSRAVVKYCPSPIKSQTIAH